MKSYNNNLVRGKHAAFLDDVQQGYLSFEKDSLANKYSEFLARANNEAEMHYFFEANPALLPGLYDLHNGPLGNVVVSKLQLANEYITDFAFISINSANSQITLIEIESPTMRVFRESDDLFSSKFNQALQQVRDWSLWIEQNTTYVKDLFRNIYFRQIFRNQRVVTRTILVAGRREDIRKNPKREKRWAGVNQGSGPVVMTYDRLAESFVLNPELLHELICKPATDISRLVRSRSVTGRSFCVGMVASSDGEPGRIAARPCAV